MPVQLSGKDIVKALGKGGWELERVTGSHHVMRHADGRHVSVPVHGAPAAPGRDARIDLPPGRPHGERTARPSFALVGDCRPSRRPRSA
jgi:predicted RNA binding protein YcfA (HicA-like mRNA interferase family)